MRNLLLLPILSAAIVWAFTGCASQPAPPPVTTAPVQPIANLTDSSFSAEVMAHRGLALVLFHSPGKEQSNFMLKMFNRLHPAYGSGIKFCIFPIADSANGKYGRYNLAMLPSTILYRNGVEIDRIRGIPERRKDLERFAGDLDLWLQNIIGKHGSTPYIGTYTYRFNDTPYLQISNF